MSSNVSERNDAAPERRLRAPFVLSIIGGVIILGVALVRIEVNAMYLTTSMPIYDRGLLYDTWNALLGEGLLSSGQISLAPIPLIAGIVVIASSIANLFSRRLMPLWGALIIAAAYASLVGAGGALIGFLLANIGGCLTLIRSHVGDFNELEDQVQMAYSRQRPEPS